MSIVRNLVFNSENDGVSIESITYKDSEGNSKDSYLVKGRAAVFGQRSKPMYMYEDSEVKGYFVIDKDSFNDAIFDHVTLLFNHDSNYPMAVYREGRENNSLRFEIKEDGLYYEAELDADDVDVQKVIKKVRNGLVFENSFSSVPSYNEGDYEIVEAPDGNIEFRINRWMEVDDISLVTSGQFKDTDIYTFNRDFVDKAMTDYKADKLLKELEFMRVREDLERLRREV